MTQIPEDAQRSEDGHYWWDGTNWQPVDQSQGAQQAAGDAGQAAGAQAAQSPEQEGEEHEQQETEKRQVTVAANGAAGEEVPAPSVEVA